MTNRINNGQLRYPGSLHTLNHIIDHTMSQIMDLKQEIKPLLVAILFVVMLSVFVDFLYPMLKAWMFWGWGEKLERSDSPDSSVWKGKSENNGVIDDENPGENSCFDDTTNNLFINQL